MRRRTKQERRSEVLRAAAELLRESDFDWAARITYGELAVRSGIDQGQIARDFGAKDDVVDALIQYVLRPEEFAHFDEHVDDFLASLPQMDSLGAALMEWAAANDSVNRSDTSQLRMEYMVWGATEPGNSQRKVLGDLRKAMLDGFTDDAEQLMGSALNAGAVSRGDLTAREFVLAITCVVEGLSVAAELYPELISEDLTGRVAVALAAAVVGPDDDGPSAQLSRTPVFADPDATAEQIPAQ